MEVCWSRVGLSIQCSDDLLMPFDDAVAALGTAF